MIDLNNISVYRHFPKVCFHVTRMHLFYFSSIKVHSSSVTRNLIYILLLFIGEFPFCCHQGFGVLPNGLPSKSLAFECTSKISAVKTAENRDSYGIPYTCYSTYSLIPIIIKIQFCPPISFRHTKSPHLYEDFSEH